MALDNPGEPSCAHPFDLAPDPRIRADELADISDQSTSLRINPAVQLLGYSGHGRVHCRIIGFGVGHANIDGVAVCRMFNRAIAGQPSPKYISTDSDPPFRFHRWLANLRVLEIDEIKTVPHVPVSHPFVERLIGIIRRELLARLFFWNALDLERKLLEFRGYYNDSRVHQSLSGNTPGERAGKPRQTCAALEEFGWQEHCRGLFHTPIAV